MSNPETSANPVESGIPHLVLSQLRSEVKELRNQVDALKLHLKNNSLRGRVRRTFAQMLCMKLHLLYQYPARHLTIPNKYWEPLPLAKPPRISIVTPSFNQGHYLEQTIRSVLDQNYPNLEYAVQDGGSRDNSPDILDRYRSQLIHAESKKDKGQAHAINLGFAHANQGEIMAYLNSDDLLLPGCLNYVAAYFAANPDVDVVYSHRVIIDPNGNEVGRWILPGHSDTMLIWADYVPQETLFWRRSIWEKAGGMIDESFQFALDWDMLLRFRAAGARFVRLPRFLGAFRVHESQKTCVDMGTVGSSEMAKLRERVHGRNIDIEEIRRNMNGYMLRHGWHNLLYRIGLSRP